MRKNAARFADDIRQHAACNFVRTLSIIGVTNVFGTKCKLFAALLRIFFVNFEILPIQKILNSVFQKIKNKLYCFWKIMGKY